MLPDNRHKLEAWLRAGTASARCVVDFGAGQFDKLAFAPPAAKRWGIEVFPAYTGFAPPGVNVVCGDMRRWDAYIPPNDRDVAMLVDSLEHLSKSDGTELLKQLIADFRRVLVFTPLGFHEQTDDATGFENEWQKHECGWFPDELAALGFAVEVDTEFHGEKGGALFATWSRA